MAKAKPASDLDAQQVVAILKKAGTKKVRDGMARFAIPADKAFGIPVGKIRDLGKKIGKNHELALELWKTEHYEARMLTAFIDDPKLVTSAQMDRWCKDFDNWAICDTLCFHLFDRTPLVWDKIAKWAPRKEEFVKRAAFALLAGLTVHDKKIGDEPFAEGLAKIEAAADDERNFVKKAVNWALRSIGKRNLALHGPAVELARRLGESKIASARWIGKDALRELTSAAVIARLAKKRR